MITKQQALDYHSSPQPGKIEVTPTKPCRTQRDLSLAYTPGVAQPCLAIEKNPHDAFNYTGRGNLVAVVTNGTAVLGLGDIGALAGKPVMEGKAVLFKRFADVNVFDIEVNSHDPDEIIKVCQLLELTFGGINLEDIKAPECFYIEETLRKTMKIPVFHDDQHGTAIITGAALLNALEIVGKDIGQHARGVQRRRRRWHCHRRTLCAAGREAGEHYFLRHQRRCLQGPHRRHESIQGALRAADRPAHAGGRHARCRCICRIVGERRCHADMVRSMAPDPIVFAMANPDPEITYEEAKACRSDIIMATGRSDYPNQVNNVLGFPFIFRGALDVRATAINEEMKLAATRALAALAKEDVPDSVCRAYGVERLSFGREYLIPTLFDPRVLVWEASAVAEAAMRTGVAQEPIDIATYREQLESRLGKAHEVTRTMIHKAQAHPKQVVFPEGENEKILRACHSLVEEKIAKPILLGDLAVVQARAHELGLSLEGMKIVNPAVSELRESYIQELFRIRQRRGVTLNEARTLINDRNVFGSMMVHMGDADALVSGVTQHFSDTIRPALQIVRMREGFHRVSGCYLLITRKGDVLFMADASVNIEPTAEDLVEIALCTAHIARRFDVHPRVAMLSFSSFGSVDHPICTKVRKAVELLHFADPTLIVDGEIMADDALSPEIIEQSYPFSALKGGANVLIFPDLASANIACKLVAKIGGCETLGPILMGMSRPVHVLAPWRSG